MKSIVEQASTVLKAIEKGWIQAGKPSEFTVKVYEHGVKNFFGISIEPAKICILFEDKLPKLSVPKQKQEPRPHHIGETQSQPLRKERTQSENKSLTAQQQVEKQLGLSTQKPIATKAIWSEELINACNQWLKDSLAVIHKESSTFTIESKKYHLIVTFSQSILDDREREKVLFRSFAHLLMQSLRNRFKKGLRGYRIILNAKHA